MKIEKRVIKIFGRVIRPANWFIFLAGLALMLLAPVVLLLVETDRLTTFILFIQGVQLVVEGYGEIKEDEDIDAT